MKLWDAETRQQQGVLRGHVGHVFRVAFSRDGQRLVSAGWDGTVRIWDISTKREIRKVQVQQGPVLVIAYSPDSLRIATVVDGRAVKLWDATAGTDIGSLMGSPGAVDGLAFSPDGRILASAGRDAGIKLWDTETRREIRNLNRSASCLAFSPDGRALAAGEGAVIKLWEVATGVELHVMRGHADEIQDIAFSRDGRRLVSARGTTRSGSGISSPDRKCSRLAGRWTLYRASHFAPTGMSLLRRAWTGVSESGMRHRSRRRCRLYAKREASWRFCWSERCPSPRFRNESAATPRSAQPSATVHWAWPRPGHRGIRALRRSERDGLNSIPRCRECEAPAKPRRARRLIAFFIEF